VSKDTEVDVSGSLLERSRWWTFPLLVAFPLDEGGEEGS